jgi:NADH:ubiquinone oxidoreductase subunit 5 (subunit L)/multisubunit Na+/H+ antiporter MnhA subunit
MYRVNDRATMFGSVLGTVTSFSLHSYSEIMSGIAATFTVLLLALKFWEKICAFFTKRSNHHKHHRKMKAKINTITTTVSLLLLTLFIVVGCTTANSHYDPANPSVDRVTGQTNNPPAVVADQARIDQVSGYAHQAVALTAPFNPYAAITNPVVDLGLAAFTTVSAVLANLQSRRKTKVNKSMAEAVVASGAGPAVMNAATNTPHFAEIAGHINEATPLDVPTKS